MARPGRPPKNQQPQTPGQAPAPAAEPTKTEATDPEAVEVKAYIPRPELAEAGAFARRAGEELAHKQAVTRERTPPDKGIECKSCGSLFIETTKTNPKMGYIRRRRRCLKCGFAWHTVEVPESEATNIPSQDA